MAEGVWVDQGLPRRLTDVLDNPLTQFQAWSILLFVNDVHPHPGTVIGDLAEPTWPLYLRRGLDPDKWTAPVVTAHVASSAWGADPVVWVNDSGPPATVYGFAIFDGALGQLVFAQRFDDDDIREIGTGEPIGVLPVLTLRTAAP